MTTPRRSSWSAPTPQVATGAAGGAGAVIVVYVASLFGLDVPAEPAAAFAVLLSFAASYLKGPP